jgi:DNA-binding beta-propeller fold protein YncE
LVVAGVVAGVVATLGLVPACGLNQEGVAPFNNNITFPASALVDPNGDWLYVANSNSDLRYNDGTLVALRLRDPNGQDVIESLRPTSLRPTSPGTTSPKGVGWDDCPKVGYIHHHSDADPGFCCWDLLDSNILNCDERRFVESQATVKIGSFAAGMAWQPICPPDGVGPTNTRARCNSQCGGTHADGRLFIGVRGNSSVTFVDITHTADGSVNLRCDLAGEPFAECDTGHRLTSNNQGIPSATADMPNPTEVLVPDEPYTLAIDLERQLLYAGHLKGDSAHPGSGGISLFDIVDPSALPPGEPATAKKPPKYLATQPSIFPPDVNTLVGVTSLTPAPAPYNQSEVFVTSRYLPRVGSVVPTGVPLDSCAPNETVLLAAGDAFDTMLPGSEVRGIQFVPDAQRAFVLQRNPPALVGFDLGQDPAGAMRVMASEILETCSAPTFLQAHNPAGAGIMLFITCFESGQVYVVDPYTPRFTNVIDVGRGPAGLAFGPGPNPSEADANFPADQTTRAYVVGFSDNNISVIDLDPASSTRFHVVMRIGFPSTVPR